MTHKNAPVHYAIGLISGTSLDCIDVALVKLDDSGFQVINTHAEEIPDNLRAEAIRLCTAGENEIERMSLLDNALGECFAQAALTVIQKAALSPEDVWVIGSHGQTIRHQPPVKAEADLQAGFSVQIANPHIIAERTGIMTVADFRQRDMAAGGQGAPLAPAFHQAVFSDADEDRVILNLGGIANITVLPKEAGAVSGFDTGPANGLMDAWAKQHYQQACDHNGEIAARGQVHKALLDRLLADHYFSQTPPKSTGREYFNAAWLNDYLKEFQLLSPDDVMASLNRLTARTVMAAVKAYAPDGARVIVCGGGVHNKTLMNALQEEHDSIVVESSAMYGINPDIVEAAAFAWLAIQTMNMHTGNLPAVTGAAHPCVLGAIYS